MAVSRKGDCRKCGNCCKDCPYRGKDHLCIVYDSGRPDWCRNGFPIDWLDLKMARLDGICGYYWEDKVRMFCPLCDAPLRKEYRKIGTGELELWFCMNREEKGCLFVANSAEPRQVAS